MNIAKLGLSGGESMPRAGTGTVPASGHPMFGETLHFRLQLASSTAKLATLDGMAGMAGMVAGTAPAFPGLETLELNALPERISFAAPEGESVDRATEEFVDTDELAPTLALLAPIVDTAPSTNFVVIGTGEIPTRAASLASITTASASATGMVTGETGDERPAGQLAANAVAPEEVLADPDGDVAALLRRVRTAGTERAPVQTVAADVDRTASGRQPETAAADIEPRLDQVQGPGAHARQPAPDLARFRAASAAVANAAAEAASYGDKPAAATAPAPDQPLVAASVSDPRVGGAMRQNDDFATSRIRGGSATLRSTARIDAPDAGRELDLTGMEPGTVEDTPFQRQVATSVVDVRAGHATPLVAQHAAGTNADPASLETGTRSDNTQTLPLDQRFSDRLGAMVGAAMGNATLKDGMLRLQVTPDHLGPIEIEMDSSGLSDRLQITVESEAVRQAVAQAQGRIEQELRQAGARLAGIDVALRDSGADAQGNAQTNAHTNSQADTDGRRPGPATNHDTASTAPDAAELRSAPGGGEAGNVLYA